MYLDPFLLFDNKCSTHDQLYHPNSGIDTCKKNKKLINVHFMESLCSSAATRNLFRLFLKPSGIQQPEQKSPSLP